MALDLFIELEMLELTEDKIYRVKNFAKHQNIKVKDKETSKNKKEGVKNTYIPQSEDFIEETNKDIVENAQDAKGGNLEIINKEIATGDNIIEDKKSGDNLQKNVPIILELKKGKKKNAIVNFSDLDEETEDETKEDTICCLSEGVMLLREDEIKISEWSFG